MTRINLDKIPAALAAHMDYSDLLDAADRLGLNIGKHADPTAPAADGLDSLDAEEIAEEDPSLVYVDLTGQIANTVHGLLHMPAHYDPTSVTAAGVQHDGQITRL